MIIRRIERCVILKQKKPLYKMKWFLIMVALILVAIPFLINELYKLGNTTGKGYITLWGANDALSFYGVILSVIGTVYLGYVAIKQNERIMHLEEKIYNRDCSSDIIINNSQTPSGKLVNLSNESNIKYENGKKLELDLTNWGNSVLSEIELDFSNGNCFKSHVVLPKGCTKQVSISIPKDSVNGSLVKCCFYSCNKVCTYGDFVLDIHSDILRCKYYHYYGLYDNMQ